MLPVIFGENLFDDLFDDAFSMRPLYDVSKALYGKHASFADGILKLTLPKSAQQKLPQTNTIAIESFRPAGGIRLNPGGLPQRVRSVSPKEGGSLFGFPLSLWYNEGKERKRRRAVCMSMIWARA